MQAERMDNRAVELRISTENEEEEGESGASGIEVFDIRELFADL